MYCEYNPKVWNRHKMTFMNHEETDKDGMNDDVPYRIIQSDVISAQFLL